MNRARIDELIARIDELETDHITSLVDDALERGEQRGHYHPPGREPYPIPEPATPNLLGLVLGGVAAALRTIRKDRP